jgi:hypothetical protein
LPLNATKPRRRMRIAAMKKWIVVVLCQLSYTESMCMSVCRNKTCKWACKQEGYISWIIVTIMKSTQLMTCMFAVANYYNVYAAHHDSFSLFLTDTEMKRTSPCAVYWNVKRRKNLCVCLINSVSRLLLHEKEINDCESIHAR